MTEWMTLKLLDLGELVNGKSIKPGLRGKYPAYGSNGLIGESSEYVFESGIIIGRVGAHCGSVAISRKPFWPSDNTIVFLPKSVDDLDYSYYLLRSANLNQHAGGSAQPLLTQVVLKNLDFQVPNESLRLKIGTVLRDFDELIENNRRRIELLEEMARSIYREWFVHFRFPGYETAAFVDSPLSLIPEGWEVATVAELSGVVSRGITPKYAPDGPTIVINQRCIRDERVSFAVARRQERPIPEVKEIRRGDVLINSTGVGTLGRVALYRSTRSGVTVDSHVTIARPRDDQLNPWYGLSLLSLAGEFERLGAGSTGQTELSRHVIGAIPLNVPPPELLNSFATAIWPLLAKVDALLETNDVIAEMRDLLLPKLVTGQIDVSQLDLDDLLKEPVG